MLNTISNNPNQITFTGKTYSRKGFRECEEFCEKVGKKVKKAATENYQAYFATKHCRLEKAIWGYKAPVGSIELQPYTGSLKKTAGFSTEAGGYGGGWIKADTSTPLSTKDVHTCALLNLVNENTNEQLMYHVYSHTSPAAIKNLITQKFPRFTRVNIMPGDQYQTNTTVNNIVDAVSEVNPKAIRQYYHMPVENPEVISVDGQLKYLENKKPDEMTFTQITNQYNY